MALGLVMALCSIGFLEVEGESRELSHESWNKYTWFVSQKRYSTMLSALFFEKLRGAGEDELLLIQEQWPCMGSF